MTGLRSRHSPLSLKGLAPGLKALAISAPLDLWLFDHTAPFDADLMSWLSGEELRRAGRFHFPAHRRRYLAAHAVLRGLIAERTGIPPSALRFDASTAGKPCLPWERAPLFSLSYSPDLCLLGISDAAPVGVDIEMSRIIPDMDELANLYFTPDEQRMLRRSQGASERSRTFLHCWTRKEACLKAMGTGLSYPASLLETHLRRRRAEVAIPGGRAQTSTMIIDGHVISWAWILPPKAPVIAERAFRSG